MKEIEWTIKALKQLRKIGDNNQRNIIYDAVENLKFFPQCQNIKKLKDRPDYRLRVGNYRILFTVDLIIIQIEEVKKRDERTY